MPKGHFRQIARQNGNMQGLRRGSLFSTVAFSRAALLTGVLLTGLAAAPAQAQKANDTLRIAFVDPISTTDPYIDPQPETTLTSEAIYDKLVVYLPDQKVFKPLLAESWKQTDPLTLEVKLREGVKFHDGKELTSDDVVYTYNYITNPKSNLRFGANWRWIKETVKVDKYRLKILFTSPTPFALARLATATPIFPAHLHAKFEGRGEFGRKSAVGTGPYKVEYVDATKGVMLVRNEDYIPPGPWSPKAAVKRIHVVPMPEIQTQIAQLMTGGLEIILKAPKDQAEQMSAMPNVASTAILNTVYHYANLDAAGRSGLEALKNADVRRALFMAINRKALTTSIIAGGAQVKVADAPCTALQIGCEASIKPVEYDPNAAKALLAKAGFASGFNLDITSIQGSHEVAEAIAGQLRAIGVRAQLTRATMGAYRKKQGDGNLQMLVANFSSGGMPDVQSVLEFYMSAAARDYWRDDSLKAMMHAAGTEMDPAKRNEILRNAFNRINEMAYLLPISNFPAVLVHSKDVTMPNISSVFSGVEFNNLKWAN